jgi:hypothetical protein
VDLDLNCHLNIADPANADAAIATEFNNRTLMAVWMVWTLLLPKLELIPQLERA